MKAETAQIRLAVDRGARTDKIQGQACFLKTRISTS